MQWDLDNVFSIVYCSCCANANGETQVTKAQAKTIQSRIETYKAALAVETNPAARKCIEEQLSCWTVELILN